MSEFADLEQRIESLCVRAGWRPPAALLAEMDAMLSEGYARALAAEARLRRLDQRLEAMETLELPDARELRAVARERHELARDIERLRARLAAMHGRYTAAGAR